MIHLFAYGTLMFEPVWQAVTGHRTPSIKGVLQGHAVFRVKGAVYPGLIPGKEDDTVHGRVYMHVDDAVVERLDRFEGNQYHRAKVAVETEQGRLDCQAYKFRNDLLHQLSEELWRKDMFLQKGHLRSFLLGYQGFNALSTDEP